MKINKRLFLKSQTKNINKKLLNENELQQTLGYKKHKTITLKS